MPFKIRMRLLTLAFSLSHQCTAGNGIHSPVGREWQNDQNGPSIALSVPALTYQMIQTNMSTIDDWEGVGAFGGERNNLYFSHSSPHLSGWDLRSGGRPLNSGSKIGCNQHLAWTVTREVGGHAHRTVGGALLPNAPFWSLLGGASRLGRGGAESRLHRHSVPKQAAFQCPRYHDHDTLSPSQHMPKEKRKENNPPGLRCLPK